MHTSQYTARSSVATISDTRQPRSLLCEFTLIELLAVIAIIAVLAALLLSAVGEVREMGRSSKCQSNLRQIGVLFMLHASDNNGELPYQTTSAADGALAWDYLLLRYTEDAYSQPSDAHTQLRNKIPPSVFACPSTDRLSCGTVQVSSYGANGTLLRAGNSSLQNLRP